jgi:hypothetical protein
MIKQLIRKWFIQDTQLVFLKGVLTGHFYSPVPKLKDLPKQPEIFPRTLPDINLREGAQLALLQSWVDAGFFTDMPFREEPANPGVLYSFSDERNRFMYADAIMLYCMMRHSQPKRIIEIGCGSSSFVMLDTNRLFFDNQIKLCHIDPFPPDYMQNQPTLLNKKVQDVSVEKFTDLEAGDILFIDSSHVSKMGSDVNHIFFNILPALRSGVRIHFHDVFYPFEYPVGWAGNGIAWQEAYLLRTFLQFNSEFEIELWTNYLIHFYREFFTQYSPLCLKDPGGSLWLKRVDSGENRNEN